MHPRLLWCLGRQFSWPHWAAHLTRTILTSVGVALGVATVVGIADVSRSVLAAFEDMVNTVAGEAELEVASPIGDVSESLVGELEILPDVEAAAGVIEQFLPLTDHPEESLYLLGVDFLDSPLWRLQLPRDQIEIADELAFVAQPDSVVLSSKFLDTHRLDLGETLQVTTSEGSRSLVVRGVLRDAPAARLFGGAIAIMDLPAAQLLLMREGRVDRVAIELADGIDSAAAEKRLHTAIEVTHGAQEGNQLEIASPEARGRQAEQLLFSLRATLAIMSLGAVIVGAFIVYHTIAISVQQRRREFALLNACGVGRARLVRLCVLETLCLAVPGVVVGVMLGRALAAAASGLVELTASEIWVRVDVSRTEPSSWGVPIGVAMGLLTALGASYAAIRATFAVPTVESLRPTGLPFESARRAALPLGVAALCLLGVWSVWLVPPEVGFFGTIASVLGSQLLGYLAMAVAAAPIVFLVGTAAARLAASRLPLPAALAAENLPRQPGRSGGTVATIGATIAIAVTVAVLVKSHDEMSLGWIEQHFGGDLFVGRGDRVRLMAPTPMPMEIELRLEGIGGVESVEPFRTIRIHLGNRPVFLQGLSVADRLRHGGLPMIEGDLRSASGALVKGTGVLLSENLAFRLGIHRGDTLELPTRRGPRQFRVEGTYVDYLGSLDLGSVLVDQAHLPLLWGDEYANLFRVWLEPGAEPESVRREVLSSLASIGDEVEEGFFVLRAGDFLESIRSVIRRFFSATWALQFVAVLVGVIGVVNTQLAAVLDRAAEIGVLRTIGVQRRDIVRSIVFECGALGALGGILGVALGLVLGAQIVLVSLRLVTGWSMALHIPWDQLLAGVVAATVVSALAGYVPARAAVRLGVPRGAVD